MNIAFYDGMLLQVALHNNKATVISKQEIGAGAINFYNYFARHRLSYKEPILNLSNCSDAEAIEIISSQPLVNQFYLDAISNHSGTSTKSNQATTQEALNYTRNLVQHTFSEFDTAFSERLDTHGDSGNVQTIFMPKQITTIFALLDDRIVQVYTVKDVYDYLSLDFYYATYPSEPVKRIGICHCCKKSFRKSQRNKVYCSKACKAKSIKENASPYYAKYRYLQQYHNRQLNKLRKQMADSPQKVQKL